MFEKDEERFDSEALERLETDGQPIYNSEYLGFGYLEDSL